MTDVVFHMLKITGPKRELKRFASCFVKAKQGDLFPQYVIDEFNDGVPVQRPVDELYFSFKKLVPRPEDNDMWLLARWGTESVGRTTIIEKLPEAIRLTFVTDWSFKLSIYTELSELFPHLTIDGQIYYCSGSDRGGLRSRANKITHVCFGPSLLLPKCA
jgi:hypothetical protein